MRNTISKFASILRKGTYGKHWHKDVNGKHIYDPTRITSDGGAWAENHETTLSHTTISNQLAEHGLGKFDTKEFRDGWLKHMSKVTPTEFLHAMFGKIHTTEGNFTGMHALSFKGDSLAMSCADCYVHGAAANIYSRHFNFGYTPKEVYHDLLQLAEGSQGGGAVKKLFKAAIPLYRKLDISRVSVSAGMDRGAYAWAKYGFNYDNPESAKGHVGWLKDRLSSVVAYPDSLPSAARADYDSVAKVLHDPDNSIKLWQLSEMKTPDLDKHLGGDIIYNHDKTPTFIKYLMRNTSYSGRLDLKNPIAMMKLARYVGKA